MFARLAKFTAKPGMEDRILDALRNQGIPTLSAIDEFVSMKVLVDRASHEEVVITVWQTRDQAEAISRMPEWQDLASRLNEDLDALPEVHIFELALAA